MTDRTESSGDLTSACLAASIEIRRVVEAVAFATDAGDWEAFLDGFTRDATCDYGEVGAGAMREILDTIRASQARYLGTMNVVGTHRAWARGADWMAETYVISHHFRRDESGQQWDDHVGTRYADRFVKVTNGVAGGADSGWRIAHRHATVLWFRQDAVGAGGWL